MRRRIVAAGGGLVVAVLAIFALLTWRDAGAAESALRDARAALRRGERVLVDDQDPVSAAAAFDEAAGLAASAETRLDGPGWALAASIPRVGGNVDLARAATDLAAAGAELGLAVADEGAELLDGSALRGLVAGGQLDLGRLADLQEVLAGLPVDPVAAARDRVAAVAPGDVLGRLRGERREAIELADGLLARVVDTSGALATFRAFLGEDGPRTYLVAAQNPAEIRGGGGLIGYLAELTVQGGEIVLRDGVTIDSEEEVARRTDVDSLVDLPPPVDRPSAFADRYDHVAGGQFFGSVNIEADLPTFGPVLLDLYAQEVGGELDGVVLVDPVALGRIVQATGEPLRLPSTAALAGLPRQFPGNQLANLIMVDGYDAFGDDQAGKKAFDEAVIAAGFAMLTAGGWDPVQMGRTLGDLAAGRHLQLYARDPEVQNGLVDLGVAGRMAPPNDGIDVLAVTANNAAANKMDVLVGHYFSGELSLRSIRDGAPPSVARTGTLTVEVDNPVRPGDHVEYVTGSSEPLAIGGQRSPRVVEALNRTWFSVWAPRATQATEVRDRASGDEPRLFTSGAIHGHRVFDYFLETPAESTNAFEIDLEGRVDLQRDGDELVYELVLWRQAKAIPDHWDLRIAPPAGWSVAGATVEGGGPPTGMGAGGEDGQRIATSVEDGGVRIVGAVTQDATIEIRLARS